MALTPEQEALSNQLTNLQLRTVLGVVAGLSQRQAYYEAGGKAKNDDIADASASELLSNPKVRAFLDCLNAQAAEKAIWTREDSVRRLSEIAQGGETTKDSESVSAIKELNSMHGWNAPSKHELSGPDGSPIPIAPTVVELVAPVSKAK